MRKKERHAYILNRARELAADGRFERWLAIEWHIRFQEKYHEARQVLDNQRIRKELDAICKRARSGTFDTETRFRALAAGADIPSALAILDRLDGRESASKS